MSDFLVLGAGGIQGEAIVYDALYNADSQHSVIAADGNRNVLDQLVRKMDSDRVKPVVADMNDQEAVRRLMGSCDAAISSVPYDFNYALAKAAMEAGAHFCDLGGNNDIVDKEFSLHEDAEKRSVKIVPDCGIAPGAVSILVARGIENIGMPDYVKIRVGGLPQQPKGLLNYMKVFSVHGLVNEYIMPTEVLRDGKRQLVESMTGIEKMFFAELGEMEAAYTSGGSSTLTKTYEGNIRELDYKTIRFPGHFQLMHDWWRRGGFDETPREDGTTVREENERILERMIDYTGHDMMVLRIELGRNPGMCNERKLTYEMIDRHDRKTGHSSMQRMTGYSAAIIAQMMVDNRISDTGVLYQEKSVPPDSFVREWKKRGIVLEQY